MKLFQTSQRETINISMITNIKPINDREIDREDAERLYTEDEYNKLIDAPDVKKCRVMHLQALWSQVEYPIVAYKVITTNGSAVISVPDYERLMKILSSWLTDDAGEDEDVADDGEYDDVESAKPAAKLTQDIFKSPDCPKWAKWAAIDEDGTVCVYRRKPQIAVGYFAARDLSVEDEDQEMMRIWHVPGWQGTLIKRED